MSSGIIGQHIRIIITGHCSHRCPTARTQRFLLNNDRFSSDYIHCADYMFPINDNNTPLYEKDTSEVTEYEMYGTKYYIMDNLGIRAIVWRNEETTPELLPR